MEHQFDRGGEPDLRQVHSTQDESLRRLNDCEVQIAVNSTRIRVLEDRVLHMVSSAEFLPVKWTFYGTIGTVMAAVLTGLVASFLSITLHR